jgi:hypothetical protein
LSLGLKALNEKGSAAALPHFQRAIQLTKLDIPGIPEFQSCPLLISQRERSDFRELSARRPNRLESEGTWQFPHNRLGRNLAPGRIL